MKKIQTKKRRFSPWRKSTSTLHSSLFTLHYSYEIYIENNEKNTDEKTQIFAVAKINLNYSLFTIHYSLFIIHYSLSSNTKEAERE